MDTETAWPFGFERALVALVPQSSRFSTSSFERDVFQHNHKFVVNNARVAFFFLTSPAFPRRAFMSPKQQHGVRFETITSATLVVSRFD